MKKIILLACVLLSILILSCQPEQPKKPPIGEGNEQPGPIFTQDSIGICRAVSIKFLQEQASESIRKSGRVSEDMLHLYGITQLYGFIVDDSLKDIILYGKVDNELPPLYLEDFIIALRNAWYKYASVDSNVYQYSYPSCSIDPDSSVMLELESMSLNNSEEQSNYNEWKRTCIRPMKVRAWGVPFRSNFNKVMVEADYYMKNIVNGSVELNIQGFISLNDTAWNIMKERLISGMSTALPIHPFNRFWFYPGEYIFYGNDNEIFLKRMTVVLKTEEQVFSSGGSITGTGKADPLASFFAKSFSDHYSGIAEEKPIYNELEGLYRMVAIAKAIKYAQQPQNNDFHECCLTRCGLDLSYLLDIFPLRTQKVENFLPGIPDMKKYQHKTDTSVHFLWLPSCGGVKIEVEVNDRNLFKSNYERSVIMEIHNKAIENRKENKSFWDFILDIFVENKVMRMNEDEGRIFLS